MSLKLKTSTSAQFFATENEWIADVMEMLQTRQIGIVGIVYVRVYIHSYGYIYIYIYTVYQCKYIYIYMYRNQMESVVFEKVVRPSHHP